MLPNHLNKLIYSIGARVLVSPSLTAAKKGKGDIGRVTAQDDNGTIYIRWEIKNCIKRKIDPSLISPAILDTKMRRTNKRKAEGPSLLSANRANYKKRTKKQQR